MRHVRPGAQQNSRKESVCTHWTALCTWPDWKQQQFIMQDWETKRRRRMTLKTVIGPGDQGEPVITIMFPEED